MVCASVCECVYGLCMCHVCVSYTGSNLELGYVGFPPLPCSCCFVVVLLVLLCVCK